MFNKTIWNAIYSFAISISCHKNRFSVVISIRVTYLRVKNCYSWVGTALASPGGSRSTTPTPISCRLQRARPEPGCSRYRHRALARTWVRIWYSTPRNCSWLAPSPDLEQYKGICPNGIWCNIFCLMKCFHFFASCLSILLLFYYKNFFFFDKLKV